MQSRGLLFLIFLSFVFSNAQDAVSTVIAKSGDGIFSILRKEGMDPSKYYAQFVALNEPNIINGSELHEGREYRLPNAPDSFKNMGRHITVPDNTERPIFTDQLMQMTLKSKKLDDALYYLVPEESEAPNTTIEPTRKFTNEIAMNLAKRLMENGARVYIIQNSALDGQTDKMGTMQDYVDVINKRYLRHSGHYQRLLMVRSNGLTSGQRLNVSVYHHDKSDAGQRLADNIREAFQKNRLKKLAIEENPEIFKDQNNLYLAKNTLPALTLVEIGNHNPQENNNYRSIRPDKEAFAKWLTNGIFKDYADLEIED